MSASNRSVLRAVSILKAFHFRDEFVSVSEVSRRAGLPFASTHRLLHALEQTGAVEKGDGGAFRLGFLIASLARNVDIDDCLCKASQDLMADFSQKFDVTVSLGRLEGNMVTIIARVLTAASRQRFAAVGSQLAAYSVALGRVMLADLSERRLDATLKDLTLDPLTPHTMTSKSRLVEELAMVRKLGYAVVREEIYVGLGCVAVPIHDHDGRVIAAMSASQKVEKLTPENVALLRSELLKLAAVLMKKILPDLPVDDHKAGSADKDRLSASRTAVSEASGAIIV